MDYISKTTKSGKTIKVKDYKKRVKRNRRNRRLMFLCFLILCFVAFALFSPFFNIKSIKCEGNNIVSSEDIIIASKIGIGNNIYRTSLKQASENIKSISYIHDVKVKQRFLNNIDINVTESTLAGYIPFENSYIYIDMYGKMLEQNPNPPTVNVPLIENTEIISYEYGKNFISSDEKKFEFIIATIEQLVHNNIIDKITLINIPTYSNLSFVINNRLEVLVGDSSNLEHKIGFIALKAYENLGNNAKGFLDVSSGKNGVFKENK